VVRALLEVLGSTAAEVLDGKRDLWVPRVRPLYAALSHPTAICMQHLVIRCTQYDSEAIPRGTMVGFSALLEGKRDLRVPRDPLSTHHCWYAAPSHLRGTVDRLVLALFHFRNRCCARVSRDGRLAQGCVSSAGRNGQHGGAPP
jgi:hypothetical protein